MRNLVTLSLNLGTTPPDKLQLFKVGPNVNKNGEPIVYNPDLKSVIMKDLTTDYLPIDLAHLSLKSIGTVDAHKAYGWFNVKFEDDGIWAVDIQWTEEAKELIINRQFRFFSPAALVNDKREIISVINFGLTNIPALHDITPMVAQKEFNMEQNETQTDKSNELENQPETLEEEISLNEDGSEATLQEDPMQVMEAIMAMLKEMMGKLDAITGEGDKEEEVPVEESTDVQSLKDQVESLQAELKAEKELAQKKEYLACFELSDKEKEFWLKQDLDASKEFFTSVKPVKAETLSNAFVNNTLEKNPVKPDNSSNVFNLPSFEEIEAMAKASKQ